MKSVDYKLIRYDADEGKVFDWANLELHKEINENGKEVINHLYAKTLFIGETDTIENYIEVEEV